MNENILIGMLIALFIMAMLNFYNIDKHLKEHRMIREKKE